MPPSDSLVFEVVLEPLYPFGRYIGKGYTLSALVLFQVVAASWYSQIDYGIEALIKQYNRFLQGNPTDWRMPVDVLSIRFEGILRDMVADYGGRVTKVGRDNSTCQALLDDLLREPRLQEVFKKEDIEFFEYVFTAKGHNIRNYVAHAFYIPQDYGMVQATLVFLCVLRLTTND